MKKLVFFAVCAAMLSFSSCGNKTTDAVVVADSTSVDSTVVDSTAMDSTVVDSTVLDVILTDKK